jgi:hypothetical protein
MDGNRGLRAGSRVRLSLPATTGLDDPHLLVLWRGGGPWQCMIPRPGAAPIAVSQIPAGADGEQHIEVVMQAAAPRQQWAVVLISGELAVDWSDEGAVSSAVLAAVAQGEASLDVVTLTVESD